MTYQNFEKLCFEKWLLFYIDNLFNFCFKSIKSTIDYISDNYNVKKNCSRVTIFIQEAIHVWYILHIYIILYIFIFSSRIFYNLQVQLFILATIHFWKLLENSSLWKATVCNFFTCWADIGCPGFVRSKWIIEKLFTAPFSYNKIWLKCVLFYDK